ncbi:F-box/FBD/LRR-repeat protein [Striga hermonthica]|uniref:F-box/FBD/LRR-repeat protein n=1 Tax=Striga hermonthica TaxID=68872 RepID=A0A9N7MJJ9_STRHE|nr:F-box/FBD/LRR-repeat protein [Striga hermonthica]
MEETRQLSGKRPKLSDGEQNMASIDRFSSLQDEVICHILSFLPTKLSVATSVLGKRWRFLWAHVPSLHFSVFDFRKEGTHVLDIIDRVLLRHKAKRMDTLTLKCVKCNEFQLETFITTAIDRSIRNLCLELDFNIFPLYLFNCKTIVDLKLDNNRASLSAVKNVSLPSLKKLYVYNLICENDDTLPRFLSGCPSLEELNMDFSFVKEDDYVGCINISSPTITMLQIDCYISCKFEYKMIINAPALRHLEVDGYDLECITIPITMISLVEADIDLTYDSFSNLKTNYTSTVVKFLHSLSYVKCLKIPDWELEEFVGVACSTVKFDNLTKLELELNFNWSLLVKFLEVADNLQVLTCRQIGFVTGYLCPEPEQVPKCLLSSLRTIEITRMEYKENELDMIRYLLRNSRVLERMVLFSACMDLDLKTQLEALKRISLFERGSSACQLDFLPDK